MLECHIDDGRLWSRHAPRRIVGCTAFILHSDERRFCERRWRQELLRHELPELRLDEWSELVKRRHWDAGARARVLADFAQVAEGHSVVGLYAAMDTSVWKSMDQRRRRLFRSPEAFCFLRVLRLVADRLEAACETIPVQLVMPARTEHLVAGAEALSFAFSMDSRASDLLGDVRFCDPRRCTYLQPLEMMLGRLQWQLAERSGDAGRRPVWSKALSAAASGAEMIGEYWDDAHCERYLASVDWDVPDQRTKRRRRT